MILLIYQNACSLCCLPFIALTFFNLACTYLHTHTHTQEKPTVSLIRTHIASEPDVLHQLMSSLFNTLLLTSHANHWAITRAILSLMLASEASFAGIILHYITSTTQYSNQITQAFYIISLIMSFLFLHHSQIIRQNWFALKHQKIKKNLRKNLQNSQLIFNDLWKLRTEIDSHKNLHFSD